MRQPLRALLLAAGLGTRLRPITLKTPKCLVPVAGQLLLERWLKKLEKAGCEAVLINTHYLSYKVELFLRARPPSSMEIITVHEDDLLGTAGTLLANKGFFKGATGLVIHADNVMVDNLQGLLASHEARVSGCLLTMLTFMTDKPESCGIVTTNDQGVVIEFEEKVRNPSGNCANGAVYVFNTPFLKWLARMDPPPRDLSTEVIPKLLGRIQSWNTAMPYIDIGTPTTLAAAQNLLTLES